MAVTRTLITFRDNFDRAQILTSTPGVNGWTIDDVSAAGAPTYLTITENGGAMRLLCANDTEVESLCMFQNDILAVDLALLDWFEIVAKVAAIGATTVLTMGLGSARADDEDAVAVSAWFKMEGATSTTAIVAETDDSATDNNDIATAETLVDVYKRFTIDFTRGLGDIRFYIEGERVAGTQLFSMAGITAGQNVQPLVQISKGATAGVPRVDIASIAYQHQSGYGA